MTQQNVFNKQFALRIGAMIKARLISYKHYYLWADEIILNSQDSPAWLLELATTKSIEKAVAIINGFLYDTDPVESFDAEQYTDEFIACLYLRHERGEISWATFLEETGKFADSNNGHRDCGYFYHKLNTLEDAEYSTSVEKSQKEEFKNEFAEAILQIRLLYQEFLPYFRKYIQQPSK